MSHGKPRKTTATLLGKHIMSEAVKDIDLPLSLDTTEDSSVL